MLFRETGSRIEHLKQCHSHALELLAVFFSSGANSYCLAFTIAAYKYTQWDIDRPIEVTGIHIETVQIHLNWQVLIRTLIVFLIVLGSNKKCQSVANFRIAPCCLPNPVPIQWKIFKNTANSGPTHVQIHNHILSWESWVMTSRGFSMRITESENRALQGETSKIEKASILHVPMQ